MGQYIIGLSSGIRVVNTFLAYQVVSERAHSN